MMVHQHPGGFVLTKRMLTYCGFKPGEKVLDIGCGTGTTVEYLEKVFALKAIGIDTSAERLQEGRERMPGIALLRAFSEALPFEDQAMDGVIAECSLSVMKKAEKAVAEMNRVLIKGGKLAITDVYAKNPFISNVEGYKTYKEWKKLLEESGFTILLWEDQSAFLREFIACLIMENESAEQFFEQTIQLARPGYFLLMAEKKANGR